MVDDGDSVGGWADDGIAHDVGYSHAVTTNDGVGVIQIPAPEARDSAQTNNFEHSFRDLNGYYGGTESEDGTESGDANTICASRGMAVGLRPKSWVN